MKSTSTYRIKSLIPSGWSTKEKLKVDAIHKDENTGVIQHSSFVLNCSFAPGIWDNFTPEMMFKSRYFDLSMAAFKKWR